MGSGYAEPYKYDSYYITSYSIPRGLQVNKSNVNNNHPLNNKKILDSNILNS